MKKLTTGLLVCVLGLTLVSTAAFAKGKPETEGSEKVKKQAEVTTTITDEQTTQEAAEVQAKNKGQEKKLEERIKVRGMNMNFDVPPVIKEGRTLIPVRAIMNGLGAEVAWDAEAKTVTITRDGKEIVINMTTGETTVDGLVVAVDVPAQNIDNRTFVPLRFIAQTLGDKVEFDEETGDINVGEEDEDTDEETDTDEEADTEEETDTETDTTEETQTQQ